MQAQIRRRRILSGSTAALLSAETFAAGFCPAAATAVGGTAVSDGFVSVCSDIDCAHYLWNGIAKGRPTPVQTFICNALDGVKPIWLGARENSSDKRRDGRFDTGGAENQIGERGDKPRGVAHSGHHLELFDAELFDLFARFDVDFM